MASLEERQYDLGRVRIGLYSPDPRRLQQIGRFWHDFVQASPSRALIDATAASPDPEKILKSGKEKPYEFVVLDGCPVPPFLYGEGEPVFNGQPHHLSHALDLAGELAERREGKLPYLCLLSAVAAPMDELLKRGIDYQFFSLENLCVTFGSWIDEAYEAHVQQAQRELFGNYLQEAITRFRGGHSGVFRGIQTEIK